MGGGEESKGGGGALAVQVTAGPAPEDAGEGPGQQEGRGLHKLSFRQSLKLAGRKLRDRCGGGGCDRQRW